MSRSGRSASKDGLVYVRGHHFIGGMLAPDSIVFDLGAHMGEFSQAVAEAYGCHCIAVEANPTLFERMARGQGIQALNYAVGATDGLVSFALDANPESSHLASDGRTGTATITVPGCTLESLRRRAGVERIDLLKLDIEGAELAVLASLDDSALREIPQITVEFHDFIEALHIGPGVEATKRRLKALGFACVVFSRTNNGDVLFVNRRHWRASPWRWFYLQYVARYLRGAGRMLRRRLRVSSSSPP